jgi:uncharacterized protein with PQ loop repeat
MTTVHPGGPAVHGSDVAQSGRAFRAALRIVSLLTMAMTVPQVVAVWTEPVVRGVSLISWAAYLVSAVLWLIYGVRRRDRTIYLACIGWMLLDAGVMVGILVHRG